MSDRPMFSVIVVTLNAENEIVTTIKSIENQQYDDYEVVVKDGGSKDSTLEKIPNEGKYHIYTMKDHSVYEGMNQAVEFAKGRYIIFLNAGDTFFNSNTLCDIAKYITSNNLENTKCVLYGNYYRKDSGIQNQPVELTAFYLYRRPLCHQSMFYNKILFQEYGMYDLKYKISADHDYTMRLWNSKIPFFHLGNAICTYEGGGISESKEGWKKALEERKKIRIKYYSHLTRIKYNTILILSFSKLRAWLDSENAPKVLNRFYILIRNGTFK